MGYGSYVAACAEVSVSDDGRLKIHRIVAATNPGHVVNPAQIERQVAGSFVYGLSALLYGEMHGQWRRDRADQFRHLQRHAHRRDAEGRDRHHADRRFLGRRRRADDRVAAPAVLNAIFAATGKRIRTMPLMNHDLKAGVRREMEPVRDRRRAPARRSADPADGAVYAALAVSIGRRRGRSTAAAGRQLVLGLPCGERRGRDAGAASGRPPAPRDRRGDAGVPLRQAAGDVMDRIAKGFSDDEIAAPSRPGTPRSRRRKRCRASHRAAAPGATS